MLGAKKPYGTYKDLLNNPIPDVLGPTASQIANISDINTIDDNGYLIESKPWFKWHYTPEEKSFEKTLQEFSNLFETIIDEQVKDKQVIQPRQNR